MKNWQKVKDEFCRKCMHYFYVGGKIYENQSRVCQKQSGECKALYASVIVKTIIISKEQGDEEK